MDKHFIKRLTILTAIFVLTAGLCCTGIQLEISLKPSSDTITVLTKDTIPSMYNNFYKPQYDYVSGQYTYKITSLPLIIYSKSCTKTNDLSQVTDSIEKYLPIDYLKIITKDKKEYIANSKKEIMQLFLSESRDGDLSY